MSHILHIFPIHLIISVKQFHYVKLFKGFYSHRTAKPELPCVTISIKPIMINDIICYFLSVQCDNQLPKTENSLDLT